MNAPSNLHGPLRRELIAVLAYVNRGAARPKRAGNSLGGAECHLDRLVMASRMQ
ncbi:MAG TPA: hypothetical protein VJR87_04030 [Allosphingosinicella sp.]|nr:hypothetical protein [Allosphingosinicella sp.]